MASSSRSISAGDPVGDVGHVLDDLGELVRYRAVRVPAQRGLRDVFGQVAHPLEVRRDVQGADDQP
jgi:hypothetical protein